jgi:hypothetical protein
LLGYLYAHFAGKWLGIKRHMLMHVAPIAGALYFLLVTIPAGLLAHPETNPVHRVLWVLLLSVGFLVLSANAPLLQKWFAATDHDAARDPYFLYCASNAGSLLGLLAYPFWLEPRLRLGEQAWFWLYVYLGFFVVAILCGFTLHGSATTHVSLPAELGPAGGEAPS